VFAQPTTVYYGEAYPVRIPTNMSPFVLLFVSLLSTPGSSSPLEWRAYNMTATIVLNAEPGVGPPRRSHAALGYSSALDFLAVFGGRDDEGAVLGDTLVLDAPGSES